MRHGLNNQNGFSLLEVLTVSAFLAIVLAMSAPNFSKWAQKHQINGESQKLYLDLLLGRMSAIKNNNNVIVTFDQGGNGYKLHNDADGDGVEDAGERIKIVNLDSRVQFGFFGTGVVDMDGNVVNNPVSLVSGGNTFTFNSRGEASTGGSIYLIHVSDAGEHNNRLRGISLVEATGAVDLWEYSASQTPPWK